MRSNGHGMRRLTRGLNAHFAVWSPDGRQVAVDDSEIDASGHHRHRIVKNGEIADWQPIPG